MYERKGVLRSFSIKNIFYGKIKLRLGVLNSFSTRNIFYNKMELRFFYFCVTICIKWV